MSNEPLDLDSLESRAAWAGSYSNGDLQGSVERFRIVREDVPALLARVRTAEARADTAETAWALCEEQIEAASRTVETAEEWEFGVARDGAYWGGAIDLDDARVLADYWTEVTPDSTWSPVRRQIGPGWQPVPPTPEEPKQRGGRIIVCTVDMDSNPEAPPVPEEPDLSPVRTRPADVSTSGPESNTTVEYADPEEVRRLSADIAARYKPLLDRLAEHDGPEEPSTARECGNDSHHGYNTGYCGDCEKEGGR